ncbi:hypothetical protein ACWCQV_41475, partial [Streptomyces eurythermus]
MTPPGRPHPADAARRALREARQRAHTEREGAARGSAEGESAVEPVEGTAEEERTGAGSAETGPGSTGSRVPTDAPDDGDPVRE